MSISSTRTRLTAGSGATSGGPSMAISGCAGPHVPGRAPVRAEQPPQLAHGGRRADQRGAAAALAQRALGERGDRRRGGLDRDQVRARVAQRHQPAALLEAPELGAEPARVGTEGPDPRLDEHVRHRVGAADLERRGPVAVIQQPGLLRALPNAQHDCQPSRIPRQPTHPEYGSAVGRAGRVDQTGPSRHRAGGEVGVQVVLHARVGRVLQRLPVVAAALHDHHAGARQQPVRVLRARVGGGRRPACPAASGSAAAPPR